MYVAHAVTAPVSAFDIIKNTMPTMFITKNKVF